MKYLISVFLISIIIFSCSKEENPVNDPDPETRAFYMGFTPFPYDITTEAVLYAYQKITSDADIIAHHFDDGVPWQESLDGTDYHPNIVADWQFRLANTPPTHKKFVSVTPISIERNSLAPYREENGNMPLPPPWDTISFKHPDVKEAYFNYCVRVMNYFDPDYFVIGIEVNLLMKLKPELWNDFFDLHKTVYQQIKTLDPDFPVFVSFTGMDLVEGYTEANHADMMMVLNNMLPFTDYFGISVYPYISNFLCDSLPNDMFDKIFALSIKPACITETGYPAENFSVFGGTVVFDGSPEKQNNYITLLLNEANKYNLEFVINFVIRDYDALWMAIGSPDDINKLWRDTGLYDENGIARIAHQLWMEKLSAPHQ